MIVRIVVTLATLLLLLVPAAGANAAAPPTAAALRVEVSDARGVTATLTLPPVQVVDGGVALPALAQTAATAQTPPLPVYALLIALPPGAAPAVTVTPGAMATVAGVSLTAAAPPAAAPLVDDSPSVSGPTGWYAVDAPLTLRGYRFVRVRLYPVRYDAPTQTLTTTNRLTLRVDFVGAQPAVPATETPDAVEAALLAQAVNATQATAWRTPQVRAAIEAALPLPTDRDLFSFPIVADGLYQLDAATLRAAGMPVDRIDPGRLHLMQGGEPVAYEWLGDGDNRFEVGEALRFFAWAYDGTRAQRQYVPHNVFWLWVGDAGDTPARVPTVVNPTGYPVANGYRAELQVEPERFWHPGWTADWPRFPNDPDAWFWHYFGQRGAPVSASFALTLTQPIAGGVPADFEIELMGRRNVEHTVHATLNGNRPVGTRSWRGLENVNLSGSVPASALRDGVNTLNLTLDSPTDDDVLLNRIGVAYMRRFEATNGVLHFVHDIEAQVEFRAGGLGSGNAADLLVWRIDRRHAPYRIGIAPGDVGGSGPYNVRVASYHEAGTEFYITTADRVRTPGGVTRYRPPDIWPRGGVDWIAIADRALVGEAQRLADYRAGASGLRTAVVAVQDVIQQVGFGLPLPQALQAYLAQLATDPQRPLRYAVLVGDGTLNPRGLPCTGGPGTCYSGWNGDEAPLVPTELLFVDRFIGQIPSDHLYAAVSGLDVGPDIAVGRLTVATPQALATVIDKTIAFEAAMRAAAPWTRRLLFVSDDTDAGGNFCQQNAASARHVPPSLTTRALCLPDNPGAADEAALRAELLAALANPGALLVNYRGHGSLTGWGAGDRIMSRDDVALWGNGGRPTVVISADCLDGNFAWPGRPAYSETLLRTPNAGSAAHWSSTGLGYSHEHTVLNEGVFSALFDHALTTIGDAVLYAKWAYLASGHDLSQLYAFTLQGDPALALAPPDLAVEQTIASPPAQVGAQGSVRITLRNNGILPTPAELNYRLPAGFTLHDPYLEPATSGTIVSAADGLTVQLATPLIADAQVTLRATLRRSDVNSYDGTPNAVATARALRGVDWAGNNTAPVALAGWQALAVRWHAPPAQAFEPLPAVWLAGGLLALTVGAWRRRR